MTGPEPEPRRQLRQMLRGLRAGRGMRQQDVTRALGWERKRLCRYETGQRYIPPAAVAALLDHYGIAGTALAEDMEELAERALGYRWGRHT